MSRLAPSMARHIECTSEQICSALLKFPAFSMLLLEGVLVVEEDVAIQVLKASGLAETQELVVNKTILNGVELVDVDDVFDLVLNKILYERVSAKGNTESTYPSAEKVLS